ncbi:MAG TPA: pitrilysin family protein [Pseudonocardia sp.]|nr:pitrilysin family protein [Pseudonocardia sp.]
MTTVTHRSAEQIGRTAAGPRGLPPLGPTRDVPLPDVVDQVLPTGLRVLAARRAAVPMVELRLRVPFADPGEVPDPTYPAVAELLSSTVLTGTATRDRVEIDDELAAVGADLGVSVDPERLSIGGSGLASGLDTVLAVLADVLTAATHPDTEVSRERERLAERIQLARAQPRTIAREALQRKRFGEHPITREMPTDAEVRAVTAEQVRALQAAALVPKGAILTLVGDIDPAAAIEQVGRRLGGWVAEQAARELSAPPPITPADLDLVHRPGSVQSQLRLSAAALPRADPGYAALQLANLVFGGYFSSRWMENIREDKGYTYGAHSGVESIPGGAVLSIETDVASDVTAPALLETRYELGRIGAVPPTPAEIDAARSYAIGSLLISLDNQGGLASMLGALAADGLDVDWLRGHPARLEAVTGEEVAAAALHFFAPSAFTGVLVGDAEVIGAGVRALGGVSGP